MKDVYLVKEANIVLDADDPVLKGVDSLILEGRTLYLDGSLQLDSLYITSGDYPSMAMASMTKDSLDGVTEKYSDGNIYGALALDGAHRDFTEISVEEFPYEGAIPLEFDNWIIVV